MKCRFCKFKAENITHKDGGVILGASTIARHVRTVHLGEWNKMRKGVAHKRHPADLVRQERDQGEVEFSDGERDENDEPLTDLFR